MNHNYSFQNLSQLARIDNPEVKSVAGVCAGISYTLGIAPWIVRLTFALLAIFSIGFMIYFILWLVLPKTYVTQSAFRARTEGGALSHPESNAVSDTVVTAQNPPHHYADNQIQDVVVKK